MWRYYKSYRYGIKMIIVEKEVWPAIYRACIKTSLSRLIENQVMTHHDKEIRGIKTLPNSSHFSAHIYSVSNSQENRCVKLFRLNRLRKPEFDSPLRSSVIS